MQKNKISIIVDTREQKPLTFLDYPSVKLQRDTLSCGDYTVVGHDMPADDNSICIERKQSCKELAGNIGANWETFKKELVKMQQFDIREIVVCGPNNWNAIVSARMTKLPLNFIYKRLAQIQVHYGISIVYFPDRNEAENYMFRLFRETVLKTNDEH